MLRPMIVELNGLWRDVRVATSVNTVILVALNVSDNEVKSKSWWKSSWKVNPFSVD